MSPPFLLHCPSFHCWVWHHMVWNTPFSVGIGCPSCVPSQLLVHPQENHCWGSASSIKHLDTASTARQWPKHPCVTNAILITDPKHTTTQASTKKSNSVPARLNTHPFCNPQKVTLGFLLYKQQTVALHFIKEYFVGFFKPTEMQKQGFFLFFLLPLVMLFKSNKKACKIDAEECEAEYILK